jgi:hypothetical protein
LKTARITAAEDRIYGFPCIDRFIPNHDDQWLQ